MKNIAIIPARSGSKGLKNKNIKLLNGKPLLGYSVEAAQKTGLFDEIMVSTDSEQYAVVARKCGAKVPFLREEGLSSDSAGSWDVVRDVLKKYFEQGRCFDTVCLLQPTSPLRDAVDIKRGYEVLQEKDADAVTSVCEVDHSPLWMMTLPEDDSLAMFRTKMQDGVPRQQLETYYRLNGAVYIRKIRYEGEKAVLQEKREYALIMERNKSIDIDTELDFNFAEYMEIKRRGEG